MVSLFTVRDCPRADRRANIRLIVRLTVQTAACLMRADLADRCCPWVPVVLMTWAGPGRAGPVIDVRSRREAGMYDLAVMCSGAGK
jgi:hypothetical protein